ncbi:MAG: maleylacetate reductase [Yoonia sp.]|uniref:maleylacetate reductase n=1 Tax=Yoonia sp. TaxID=2212373 RepID=UPI003EF2A1DA
MQKVDAFVFGGLRSRVIFGAGTVAQVGQEIKAFGARRAMVLTTPEQAQAGQNLAGQLGTVAGPLFSGATMHTPVEVTAKAIEAFEASGCDCVVSLGGGSTIGLGKAIAVRKGVRHLAIPTTYAGSEMTDILGETSGGEKTTRRHPSIRPDTVIYDVDLTLTLPFALSVTSGLNAIAHAIEALYAEDANPITDWMAFEGIKSLHEGLPRLDGNLTDVAARSQVLYGSWLCSIVLGQCAMALHHKLAHVLGGTFDLPHGATHSVLLPHTAGFNAHGLKQLKSVTELFGGTLGSGLWDFSKALGAPMRLSDLGLSEGDLPHAADLAMKASYANPRVYTRENIFQLISAAQRGERPAA